ncbi:MAG: SIR2 family protein [Acholeplasma sp.]|nr:SIR2 family protein [Acholeplasma sp.]
MIDNLLDSQTVLLLGNGINRYTTKKYNLPEDFSWNGILLSLLNENGLLYQSIPKMFPFTEVFEIIKSSKEIDDKKLKQQFVRKLKNLKTSEVHKKIIDLCSNKHIDILTTNFDLSLEATYNFVRRSEISRKKNFSRWYPWSVYYTSQEDARTYPRIFHIQGDINYNDSVRLTVKDYIHSFNHFNKYKPNNDKSLYNKVYTWVNIFFEKQLLIVGLSLDEQEFFLRQLLYLKKQLAKDSTEKIGTYIICKEDTELFDGQGIETSKMKRLRFFADSLRLDLEEYDTFENIYSRFE